MAAKSKNAGFIRLNQQATSSVSVMLTELLKENQKIKVDGSRLVSHIVQEFYKKYFNKQKPQLIDAHLDKKKKIIENISTLNPDKLNAALKYLERMKNTNINEEKLQKN